MYSEFHVSECYNLQPVYNELTLCVQWNSIFFQTGSVGCSGPTLHETFCRKTLFRVLDWSHMKVKAITPVNSNLLRNI